MKKLAKIMLVAILAFAITPLANTQAKAKVKLNKTSISLQKGKTYTLKVKGTKKKPKWSSNKKSIATVSKKGKVTAKKAGNAVITAKIGKKKYTCKVKVWQKTQTKKPTTTTTEVKKPTTTTTEIKKPTTTTPEDNTTTIDPIGTRTNPADPKNGVTIETNQGTMYFKLTEVLKGTEAESKLLDMGESETRLNECRDENPNTTMVLFTYDVKAVKGYSEYSLQGLDIFNSYGLYDGECSKNIDQIEEFYFVDGDYQALNVAKLELYTGAESKMYVALWVPDGMNSFSNYIEVKDANEYWIKYIF